MNAEIGEILITADEIAARVRKLGSTLAQVYAGREPVIVAVMKGCVVFLADLVRAWPGPMDIEFVSSESYDGTVAGEVRLVLPSDLGPRVEGRPVLVLDDIYDTGGTLAAVCCTLQAFRPAEVRTLVLFRKRRKAATVLSGPVCDACPPLRPPDWIGFDIPDCFVVGYGLDFRGRYRNLPYLAVLREVP
jgi:hypoxanthine phosphoribosyltransferase